MADTTDILWDISARDLTIENGDFVLQSNSSAVNGGVIKECDIVDPTNPYYGIGLSDAINAPVDVATFQMNRWISQVKRDGAVMANFSITNKDNITNIAINIQY